MRRFGNRILLSLVLCAFLSTASWADDTDVYLNPATAVGSEPLVIFTLDYRSNLGSTACGGNECDTLIAEGYLPAVGPYTFFDVLRGALKKVLDSLEGVKVGFMVNHANSCNGNNTSGPGVTKCSNGGYVLFGLNSMLAGDTNGKKAELASKLAAMPTPGGNLNHSFQGKELYFELFRFLTGQDVYNAHLGYQDYGDNDKNTTLNDDFPSLSRDLTVETGNSYVTPSTYISPLSALASCANIYVINFMFQVSNQEDNSDDAITAGLASGGMSGINISGNRNNFDTVIEYMKDVDLANGTFGTVGSLDGTQNVVSYFFVDETKINQTTTGYATAGGTSAPFPLSDNPDELVSSLNNIFTSILSISTSFVAPSVPVNVFNRAQIVDEVFFALFEADEDSLPFWNGNLKKLKIGVNLNNEKELQDVTSAPAIDIDGRIKRDAVTFWTTSATLPAAADDEVDGADGRAVARGGAGQNIPGVNSGNPGTSNATGGARQIFTEDPTDATDGLMDLNADAETAAAVWTELTAKWSPAATATTYAAATTAEQTQAINLLRFARGLLDDGTTPRNWVLGDPLHSRPQPVNYGARTTGFDVDNPDIRILMGTNDGFMRMFQNTGSSGNQDGSENWAFIPRAVIPLLDRLHQNLGGTPIHPIGTDGSPAVFTDDVNSDSNLKSVDGDSAVAIFGLRRGGKNYYAIDVSNPDIPKFLWKVEKDDPSGSFAELAQTWGTPQIGTVKLSGVNTNVAIVAGGYNGDDNGDDSGDLGKDAKNRDTRAGNSLSVGSNDAEGNAIFMIKLSDGSLIWKAIDGTGGFDAGLNAYKHEDMNDSFADALSAIDTNGDGLLDRIYAGDTGGVVWRVDLGDYVTSGLTESLVIDDTSKWTVVKLFSDGRQAKLSAALTPAVADDRRFFNAPDVAQSRDALPFDAVIIGTGDREDPNNTATTNRFYVIKDRFLEVGRPPTTTLTASDLVDLTNESSNCIVTDACDAASITSGWYLDLTTAGEKNLAPALTAGGTVLFTTFAPASSSGTCTLSEGTGRVYAVDLQTAEAVIDFDTTNNVDGNTVYERVDVLGSGGIPVQVVPLGEGLVLIQGQEAGENIVNIPGNTSYKTYWYEQYQ